MKLDLFRRRIEKPHLQTSHVNSFPREIGQRDLTYWGGTDQREACQSVHPVGPRAMKLRRSRTTRFPRAIAYCVAHLTRMHHTQLRPKNFFTEQTPAILYAKNFRCATVVTSCSSHLCVRAPCPRCNGSGIAQVGFIRVKGITIRRGNDRA